MYNNEKQQIVRTRLSVYPINFPSQFYRCRFVTTWINKICFRTFLDMTVLQDGIIRISPSPPNNVFQQDRGKHTENNVFFQEFWTGTTLLLC